MSQGSTLNRSEFIRAVGAAGFAALFVPPTQAHAATGKKVSQANYDRFQTLKQSCNAKLTLDYRPDDGGELQRVAAWIKECGFTSDVYGKGTLAQDLEAKIASKLGKEAACWMPTGTMAQLSALRVYGDESKSRTIGWHPSSHHLLHEKDAYSHLHSLKSRVLSPWERPILPADLDDASDLSAISVELPARWIGQLQTWQELTELKEKAKDLGVPLLMDGARLWEAQPHYGKSYAEICDGFDSVYVSFYKMIGAISGAMLAGRRTFIEKAKVWRHRHGGNVYQNLASIASASMRLHETLPQLQGYYDRAVALSNLLKRNPNFVVMPAPAQTNLFRVFIPGTPEDIAARRDAIAEKHQIWVGDYFRPSRVPGMTQVELQIGSALGDLSEQDAASAFGLLAPT